MKPYQIESLKIASKVLKSCHAQLALEEAIFDGPQAESEPLFITVGAILLGLAGIATWTATLYLVIHA